jgi:hypothetical protein
MMSMRDTAALACAAFAILTIAACGESGSELPPAALDDELAVEEDNGAQGRDPFSNPAHVAPIDACDDVLVATGESLVIRVLPTGPRNADGSLAFTSGVCVYLPPGYADSGLRYPVLYLLHGGGGDAADWVTYGGIQSIMDGLVAADAANAAIVVMPDGTDAQWHDSLDGRLWNQEYVLEYLVPYVDRHFRTIAQRDGRVIDGLSNGGYGALHLSAKAPDRFVAAGAMSANLAALTFAGLGDPLSSPAYRPGNLPLDLATNLDDVDLTMDIGTSASPTANATTVSRTGSNSSLSPPIGSLRCVSRMCGASVTRCSNIAKPRAGIRGTGGPYGWASAIFRFCWRARLIRGLPASWACLPSCRQH